MNRGLLLYLGLYFNNLRWLLLNFNILFLLNYFNILIYLLEMDSSKKWSSKDVLSNSYFYLVYVSLTVIYQSYQV